MNMLVFWQNIPSIHQAPLVREVAKLWRGKVIVVAENDISSERIQQGWERPNFSPAHIVISPNRDERLRLIQNSSDNQSVHIFSGFHAYPETYWSLNQANKTDAFLGIFAEPGRDDEGLRSFLRRLRYSAHGIKWRNKLSFLLVTGELGENWYSRCFFAKQKIYPYGYFVDHFPISPSSVSKESIMNMLFVGQLATRKGLDLLLKALSELKHEQWMLRIVGTGAQRTMLEDLARALCINDSIEWLGALSNQEVRALMASSDLFVLPSRYDGWGAVVNESLMSGTPVAVSNACGASDLISNLSLGYVFEANSVEALCLTLQAAIENGPISFSSRQNIREWAGRSIHPAVAAQYLIEIINSVRNSTAKPCVPWRTCE